MLMRNNNGTARQPAAVPLNGPHATSEAASREIKSSTRQNPLPRALRIEWLGQMVASVCWIASVLTYGISSSGDWWQLFAASAWLLANIASLTTAEAD